MSGLSRRSVLFAPVAAALAAAPEPERVLRPLALRWRVLDLGQSRFAPSYAEEPFRVLSPELESFMVRHGDFGRSLPAGCVDSQIGDHGDRCSDDRAPRGSGFSEGSCFDRLADDRVAAQEFDVGDERLDRSAPLLAIPFEQLKDQRAEDELGGADSGDRGGERRFGFVVHFMNSLVSVATAMVERAGRICKNSRPAVLCFLTDCIAAAVADDHETTGALNE